MQRVHALIVVVVTLLPSAMLLSASVEKSSAISLPQIESGTIGDEYDTESSRKIIGSRYLLKTLISYLNLNNAQKMIVNSIEKIKKINIKTIVPISYFENVSSF